MTVDALLTTGSVGTFSLSGKSPAGLRANSGFVPWIKKEIPNERAITKATPKRNTELFSVCHQRNVLWAFVAFLACRCVLGAAGILIIATDM